MSASRERSMVPVYVCEGHLQAEVIKSKLEAAGIPVLLQYESLGVVLGLTVDGLGQVKVMVPAEDAEEARALLQEVEYDEGSEDAESDEEEPPWLD